MKISNKSYLPKKIVNFTHAVITELNITIVINIINNSVILIALLSSKNAYSKQIANTPLKLLIYF